MGTPEEVAQLRAIVVAFGIEYERALRENAEQLKELADEWSVCDGDGLT